MDPTRADDVPDDAVPLEAEEFDPLAGTSRYAVPLSALVGGSFVPVADQVEVHPEPPPPASSVEASPMFGGVDGD